MVVGPRDGRCSGVVDAPAVGVQLAVPALEKVRGPEVAEPEDGRAHVLVVARNHAATAAGTERPDGRAAGAAQAVVDLHREEPQLGDVGGWQSDEIGIASIAVLVAVAHDYVVQGTAIRRGEPGEMGAQEREPIAAPVVVGRRDGRLQKDPMSHSGERDCSPFCQLTLGALGDGVGML